jgi:hypothetical protein
MAINDITLFLKRRFNQKEFDKCIVTAMYDWIGDVANYREFEVNVIHNSILNYFWDYFKYDFFDQTDLDDANQFESFVTNKYEQKLRDYYNKYFLPF